MAVRTAVGYGVVLQYYRAYSQQSGWRQCDGTVWQLGSTDLSSDGSRTCSINGGVGFNNVDKETLGPWGGNYTTGFDGTGLHGYPGRDQPGFTTGQVSSPIYIWNQSPDVGSDTGLEATRLMRHCSQHSSCEGRD